jgi:F420-non-reducing hydrogenase iron-sulfur subunit
MAEEGESVGQEGMAGEEEFEPLIIAFCCNWCSYAGADLAGTSRLQYPPNIRIIRVMCSGMVHPNLVIDALSKGADGVLMCGCHPGDCHYLEGNLKAEKRAEAIELLLEDLGIEPERYRLEWISASEGQKFAQTMKEFTDTIKSLGPSPYRMY